MLYAKSDLNEIRAKVDMLTYMEKRGITFRQSGASWVALCPVHGERSPSFHVKPDTQTFKCFGCGISGDIFSLVQAWEGIGFSYAVQELAEEAGIELKVEEDPDYKRRQRLYTITRMASEWFRYNYRNLPEDHAAKQNLAPRKLYEYSLSDESIGYAPNDGLVRLLGAKGYGVEEVIAAGLAKRSEKDSNHVYEAFRNRLVWTIYDVQGKPIGFSARKIFDNDNGPKYLNSPQTELYNKSKALLGLADAKKAIAQEQMVYVVEGQTDVMAMKAAGMVNTVASCGTAFGSDHANMLLNLSKLGRESEKFKIVFCFDGDEAGVKAAKSVFEKNKNIHLNSYVVKITNPDGSASDPCDLRKDHGDETLRKLVTGGEQLSIVEFILREELKNWDVSKPEGQSGFITKSKEILSLITDPIQFSSYLRKVSYWTGISLSQLTSMMRQNSQPTQKAPVQNVEAVVGDPFETKILAAITQYPKESLELIAKYKMDRSFFPTRTDLALQLVQQAKSADGIDFSDPEVSSLSHTELMIIESRKQFGLDMLFKNYLKHLYTVELGKLNSRIASQSDVNSESGGGDNLFEEILRAQEELKVKYHA